MFDMRALQQPMQDNRLLPGGLRTGGPMPAMRGPTKPMLWTGGNQPAEPAMTMQTGGNQPPQPAFRARVGGWADDERLFRPWHNPMLWRFIP